MSVAGTLRTSRVAIINVRFRGPSRHRAKLTLGKTVGLPEEIPATTVIDL